MHGMRLLFAITFCSSTVLTLFSTLIYLPWFRKELELRDPLEYERSGSWRYVGGSNLVRACLYFVRREYRRSLDPGIRRHGSTLRWTFSVPLLLALLTLLVAMTTGAWLR